MNEHYTQEIELLEDKVTDEIARTATLRVELLKVVQDMGKTEDLNEVEDFTAQVDHIIQTITESISQYRECKEGIEFYRSSITK